MEKKKFTINPSRKLDDDVLFRVEKPARYTGGELNMIRKDPQTVNLRFAFCFPDLYEVGMSHLGSRILYHTMNARPDTYCERAFCPNPDLEAIMREEGIALSTLETGTCLQAFDLVGFTLQYEMSYTNILNMLELSGIPLKSAERGEHDPLVMAGGPCASNPEPLHQFIDFFEIGEGEFMMDEVLSVCRQAKENGATRRETLQALAQVPGVYVPSFYDVTYQEDGTIRQRVKLWDKAPDHVQKQLIRDFDAVSFPDQIIVPYCEPTHDRIMVETFRGCTRGCRFCMAGMIYRPVREKRSDTILALADELIRQTGYEEISLTSLSTCDYSDIERLITQLVDKYQDEKIAVSLPSIRVDAFGVELINEIQKIRKTGLTFAPEAGSQRMRDIINKNVTEEDILKATYSAFSMGWSTIKLYTMIGLPYETTEDAIAIAELAEKIVGQYYAVPKEQRQKGLKVNLSTSIFIPKPFTPFQWAPQESRERVLEKVYEIKHHLKTRAIQFSWHESELSRLEAVVSRGDRRVSDLILRAFELGAKMDGWTELFNLEAWNQAIDQTGLDVDFYAFRERSYDEVLPWDFVDIGVKKEYLIAENEKAKAAITTRDCRDGCTLCGINETYGRGICFNGSLLHSAHQS
ncbi:MAG: TIGR03960 family B12-binding radical SAM protein [Clostridiaceae bacterium]